VSFTNPVSSFGTASSGSSVSTATFTAPASNQLLVIAVRAVCSSTPVITATGFTAIGSPLLLNGGAGIYEQLLYKALSSGSETSVTANVTNANFGSGNNAAGIGYVEIDGFTGTPTLDQQAALAGSAGVQNHGATGTVTTTVASEVFVTAVATNAVTATSQAGDFASVGQGQAAGATTTHQAVEVAALSSIETAQTFHWTWVTTSLWGVVGATFYDLTSTTTTQTQSGVARIQATTSKTQSGVARIQATTTRTQSGVGRIQQTDIKTQQGVARITAQTSRTQPGVARITATTTRTQTGVAHISAASATTRTQPGVARIQVTTTKTQSGVARIQLVTTKTQTGRSRITATTTQTQQGVARVQATTTRTQTGVAHISAAGATTRTQPGVARIQVTTTRTQSGVARIQLVTTRTQTGHARITASTLRTQSGVGRIQITTTRTQQGVSRIATVDTKTQTGVARVQVSTPRTQTGVAHISAAAGTTRTQTGHARIQVSTGRTQTGVARIAGNGPAASGLPGLVNPTSRAGQDSPTSLAGLVH